MSQQEKPLGPLASAEPWELVAEGYAAEAPHLMLGFSRRALALLEPSASDHVVDVAAGPGTLSLEIAPRVQQVDALDFSAQMLAQLDKQARARGIGNVRTMLGDGQALPFADRQYDLAFSMFGLMFFPDRARGYAELFRVLRPGGRALVSSWAPLEDSSLMSLMFAAARAVEPDFPPPRRDPLGLENPEVLAAELRGAGFVDVRVEPHTESITPASASELWAGLLRGSAPLTLLRHRLGEAEWARRVPEGLKVVESGLEGGQRTLSTTAWLGFGTRPG